MYSSNCDPGTEDMHTLVRFGIFLEFGDFMSIIFQIYNIQKKYFAVLKSTLGIVQKRS